MDALFLADALNVSQAKPLFDALVARRGADLALHASEVTHLGAQCAQVLVSARNTWASDGHALRITDPSEAFTAGARLLGLFSTFEGSFS